MASVVEAKLGAIFICAQYTILIRTTLIEINHPQSPTPIQVYRSTAVGITNSTLKQHQSKAMDMRFYWDTYMINQGQFIVYRRSGATNLGNYHSKL